MKHNPLFLALAILVVGATAAIATNTGFLTEKGTFFFPFSPPNRGNGQNGTIGDPLGGGMAPLNGNLAYT